MFSILKLALLIFLAACLLLKPSAARADDTPSLGRIGEISVDGNTYTREDVVRSAAGLKTGEPLSADRLRWALHNMGRRRLWARYTILTRPGQLPGTTAIRLRVLERTPFPPFLPGTMALLPSYDGLFLREENLLGGGAALTFRGRWLRPKVVRLDLTEPNLLGSPWFAELTVFYYKKDQQDGRVLFRPFVFYDERKVGGDLVVGWHLTPNDRLGMDYHLSQEDAWVTLGSEPDRHELARSIGLFYVRDTRSSIVNADSGNVLRLAGAFHPPGQGGRPDYQRYSLDFVQFIPLEDSHQLVFRAFGGLSRGPVPFYHLWRLGEIGNKDLYEFDTWGHFALVGSVLRAYQEGALIGEKAVNASLEYRFPLFRFELAQMPLTLGGVLAFDVGGAWRNAQPWDWGQLRWALGWGLRLISPLATFRLDLGFHPESQALFVGTEQVF